MALDGGGGGGGPVGFANSFTGPTEALEIAGDFAYAYNQVGTELLQSITNTLDFTTGNFLFVGHLTCCGAIRQDESSPTGGIDQFYLSLNGSVLMSLRTEGNNENSPLTYTIPIIIPAYTKVEVSAVSATNNNLWEVSNTLTGRIYR